MELKTNFQNIHKRDYEVKVTVAIAHKFCRERGLKIEELSPDRIDFAQTIDLAYMGSRTSKLQTYGETKEEFMEGLEGDCLGDACDATVMALINFFHRTGTKETKRACEIMVRQIEEASQTIQDLNNAEEQLEKAIENGSGGTSSESAEPAESTPQPAT